MAQQRLVQGTVVVPGRDPFDVVAPVFVFARPFRREQHAGRHRALTGGMADIEALDALGETIVPMSYSMASFAKLGLLDQLIEGVDADAPDASQIERVRQVLSEQIHSAREGGRTLAHRLESAAARKNRAASIEVRRRLAEQWDAV